MTDIYRLNQIREELNRDDLEAWNLSAVDKLKWMLQHVRRDIFEDDTFADFGGGDGTVARVFADVTRCQSTVVDLCDDRLVVAKERGLLTLNSELETLPLADSSINWAYCGHTLEHVRDLDATLASLYRVVSNGIAITVPLETAEHAATSNTAHLRSSTEPSWWQQQIEQAGFVVEATRIGLEQPEMTFLCFKPEFYAQWRQGAHSAEALATPSKFDVVVAYFRQQQFWPRVLEGLQSNSACINRVIVVNDEPWQETLDAGGLDMQFLTHERRGRGPSESFNQGVAAATTPHVLLMEGDIILPRGALLEDSPRAEPDTMLLRGVVRVDPESNAMLQADWRAQRASGMIASQRQWNLMQCNYILADRQCFLALDGFNEAMCAMHGTGGYSEEDTDLGVRWMAKYTPQSLVFSSGDPVIHLGGRRNTDPLCPQFTPLEAREGMAESLGELYGQRWHLFCGDHRINTAVNVNHLDRSDAMDIRLDCIDLRWLPSGSAAAITATPPLEYFTEQRFYDWVLRVVGKLAPDAMLNLFIAPHHWLTTEKVESRMAAEGLANQVKVRAA